MSEPAAAGSGSGSGSSTSSNAPRPHKMRITSGGSMQLYVDFAVKSLLDDPNTPLVLHTLPSPSSATAPSNAAIDNTNAKASSSSSTFLPCTLAVPRLISVVEIIKRVYLERLAVRGPPSADNKGKGKAKGKEVLHSAEDEVQVRMNGAIGSGSGSKGIWQYTTSGLYHPPTVETGGEDALGELERVLGGRTKPKMIHHPYLSITLSARPLGLEAGNANTSVQYVLARKRRRGRRAAGAGAGAGAEEPRMAAEEDGQLGGSGTAPAGARAGKRKSDLPLGGGKKRRT